MTYTFYSDPGHGWLMVPRAEIVKLGIADQISGYSYQKGDNVYLEEDCDAGLFIDAAGLDLSGGLEGAGIKEFTYRTHRAPIRTFAPYSPEETTPNA